MFKTFSIDIRHFIRTDEPLTTVSGLRAIKDNYGLQALLVFRFGKQLLKLRSIPLAWPFLLILFPVYWILAAIVTLFYGIKLRLSADIGEGFYIGHFGGILIQDCVIAEGCAVNQQVEIRPSGTDGSGPVIGKNVWIGAHAKITGAVTIGDGATIGAGAVVTEDIPARCLVLGNPARVARKDYDNRSFR